MGTFISVLRGINVGGKARIGMEELRALCRELGFEKVETYIQSGNIVFSSGVADPMEVSRTLETGIGKKFGQQVKVITLTPRTLGRTVAQNPFSGNGEVSIKELHLTLLSDPPRKPLLKKLAESVSGPDRFHVSGKNIYLHCPNGYGRTRLTNNFFEKSLQVNATTRNWKTVVTLRDMAEKHHR